MSVHPISAFVGAGTIPPTELESLTFMLWVSRATLVVVGTVTFLTFLVSLYGAIIGETAGLLAPLLLLLVAGVEGVIYFGLHDVEHHVRAGRYSEAKQKTAVWAILGFPFGWVIVGVPILVAWLKFDPLIGWQRQMGQGSAPPFAVPSDVRSASPAQIPPSASTPSVARCPRCGRPIWWIGPFGRWYCFGCQQYL